MPHKHCQEEDAYEIHVTALPDRPGEPISWDNQAVITTDCCEILLAVVDVLRHHGGMAHFGPMGSLGPVSEKAEALGVELLEEIREYGGQLLREQMKRWTAPLN